MFWTCIQRNNLFQQFVCEVGCTSFFRSCLLNQIQSLAPPRSYSHTVTPRHVPKLSSQSMCYTIVTQNYFLRRGGDCRLVQIYRLFRRSCCSTWSQKSLKFSNPANEIHSVSCFVHVLFLNISVYFLLDPQITKYREGSFAISPSLTAD